ncbi:uncharacterized protein LOC111603007 isoform X2 [Drosophila hydei]|uniref:Uncharacterized protein LOC111603007 isoform X2 n=1 Tax=Drosophila hydei TaxID=7224 RepID=A0A6J1M520_DROHY|nr:uncharacterized protein LOC111603007 isoform X2 [Drosophila hydei]
MSNMLYWRLAQPLYTYLSVRFVCYRPLAPMIRYLHKDKTGPDSEFKKRLRQRLHKAIEAKVDNLKEKQRASTSGTPADSASASKKDVKKVNPPPSIKVIDNSKNLYGIEYPSQMYKDSQPPPETSPATLKKSNEKDVGLNTDKPTFESRAKAFVESSIIKEQESKGTPDKSRNDENKKNSQKNNPNNSASTSTSVDWTKISPNQDPLKEKIIKQNKTDLKKLTAATKRLESQKEFKRKDNKTLIESKPQTPRDGLFKHNADPYKTKLHEKSYEKPPTAQSMKSGYGPISKSKPIVNRIEQLSQAEAEAEAKAAIANMKMKTEAKAGMKAEQVAKAKSEVKAEVKAESKAQAAAKVQAKADPAKGETISQANVSTSNETKSGKRQTNNSAGVAQDPKNASSNIKITDRRNTAVESGSVETGSQNKKVNTKGTSESESEQSDIICDAEGNKMFVGGSVNKLSRGGNESSKNKQKRLSFKTLQFKTKNYLVENRYSKKKAISPKVEKSLFTSKPTQSHMGMKLKTSIKYEMDAKRNTKSLNKDKDDLSKWKDFQSGLSNLDVSTKSEKKIMSPKVEKNLFTNKPTQSQLKIKASPEINSERDRKGGLNKNKDGLSKSKVSQSGLSNMGVSTKSEKEITSPKVEKSLFTNKPTQSQLETKVNPEIKSERDPKGSLNKDKDDLSKSKVCHRGLSNMGVSTKSEKEIMSPKVEKNLFTNKPTQSQLETKVNPEIKSERDLKESLNKVNDDLSKSNVFQSGLSNTNLSVKSERGTTSSKVKKNIFVSKPTQSQIETKLKTAIGKIKSEMDTNDSKGASCDKTKATNSKTQQNKVGSTSNIEKWLSRARELKAHQQQQFSKKKSPVDIIRKAFNAKYPPISPAKGTKSTDTKGSKSNTPPPVKDSLESLDPMISSPTLGNKICDNTVKPGEIHLVASGNIVINTAQTQLNPLLTPDSINADLNKKDSSLNKPGTNDRKPKTSQVVKPKFGFTVPLNLEAADEIPNNKNNPVESLLQNELKNPLISKENNFKENQITIAEIIKKLSQTSKRKADSIRSLNESRKSREQLEPVKGNPTKTSPTGTTNDKFSKKPVSEKTSDQILSRSITSDTIVSKIASESTDLDQSDFSTPSQSFGNSAEGETVASYGKTLCFASEECQISKITASADIADVGNYK